VAITPALLSAWHPQLVDYIYISFTSFIAFNPTDAMPLSRWAKLLMLSESGVSAIAVLLVAGRAVNIFEWSSDSSRGPPDGHRSGGGGERCGAAGGWEQLIARGSEDPCAPRSSRRES
jgi:hypothetical protein